MLIRGSYQSYISLHCYNKSATNNYNLQFTNPNCFKRFVPPQKSFKGLRPLSLDKMGNLSSCIGIRGRNREDDYKYLELRPPALIDGYETLSHMYYTHARMAILHLNNDTGHFLKHKVVRVITLQRCPSPHSQCFVACFLGYSTGWRVDTVATFCPSKPSGTHEGKHNKIWQTRGSTSLHSVSLGHSSSFCSCFLRSSFHNFFLAWLHSSCSIFPPACGIAMKSFNQNLELTC